MSKVNSRCIVVVLALLALVAGAGVASAADEVTSVNAVGYIKVSVSAGGLMEFLPGDPVGDVSMSDPILVTQPGLVQSSAGLDEVNTVDAVLTGTLLPGGETFELTGPIELIVKDKGSNTTGSWDTEMVSMSLTGSLPISGGLPVELREDPAQASTGHVNVTDIGGGLFLIDSFFDVFTELSIDGGGWIPATASDRFNLIPEPATMTLLAIGGITLIRKRRRR